MMKSLPLLRIGLGLLWLVTGGNLFPRGEIFAKETTKDTERIHLVSQGESLHKIALKYFPLSGALTVWEFIGEIREINGIQGDLLRPKQRLLIPVKGLALAKEKKVKKPIDFEAKGIYANRYSLGSRKRIRLLDGLINSGGNTIVIDGKDMTGRLSYPTRVPLAKAIRADKRPMIRDPIKLFRYLQEKGIHVIVRLVLFYDPLLAANRPELTLRSMITGKPILERGKLGWVDPYKETVKRYNLDIAKELAEMGVDEIQFDYVRFPTVKDGRSVVYRHEKGEILRHKIITDFVAQARRELAPYKVLLSIDVFGIIAWGRQEDIFVIGQKVEDLARYVDVISPMIYPSHFSSPFQGIARPADQPFLLVSEACRRFSELLKDSDVTLRPWIQAFPLGTRKFNEKYIVEQLRALAQWKTRGWLLWSAGNRYDTAWKALALWNSMAMEKTGIRQEASIVD